MALLFKQFIAGNDFIKRFFVGRDGRQFAVDDDFCFEQFQCVVGECVQNRLELRAVNEYPVVGMVEQLAEESEGYFKLF